MSKNTPALKKMLSAYQVAKQLEMAGVLRKGTALLVAARIPLKKGTKK